MAAKSVSNRRTEGRYSGTAGAVLPGDLPREGKRRGDVHVVHGTVSDPNPALTGRQKVAINRNTDALEFAYSRKLVSDGAYSAGRVYQAVLERAAGIIAADGEIAFGVRSDPVSARDFAMMYRIHNAREAVEMIDETARVVGMVGGMVLEKTLGIERLTIAELSRRAGGGRLTAAYYSRVFQDSLENLADFWAMKCERQPRARS